MPRAYYILVAAHSLCLQHVLMILCKLPDLDICLRPSINPPMPSYATAGMPRVYSRIPATLQNHFFGLGLAAC